MQLGRIFRLREIGKSQGDGDVFPLFDGKRRLPCSGSGGPPFGLVAFNHQVGKLFLERVDVLRVWFPGSDEDEFVAFEGWVRFSFVVEGGEFDERHCEVCCGVAVVLC